MLRTLNQGDRLRCPGARGTMSAPVGLVLRGDNRCVLAATATAVLLLTDAWLDVTSAARGDELLTAIAMAVFAEAPIALACSALALRLIRHPFPSATETAGTDTQEEQRCP